MTVFGDIERMTTIVRVPFKGASREGVDQIKAAISESALRARSSIEIAIREHGENVSEVILPSERAYEIEWAKWEAHRDRLISNSRFNPIASAVVTAIIASVLSLPFMATRSLNLDGPFLIFSIGIVATLCIGTVITIWNWIAHAREKRKGFTTWFIELMPLQVNGAWALSDEALYVFQQDDADTPEMIDIVRIPFEDIQACVHGEGGGSKFSRVYDKEGDSFTILDPRGDSVNGAATLAQYVWSLSARKRELLAIPSSAVKNT